jgi:transcription factor TFIIIB component B''
VLTTSALSPPKKRRNMRQRPTTRGEATREVVEEENEHLKKTTSKRRSAREKRHLNTAPDHSKMTMAELISYNPSANPMKRENRKRQRKGKEDEQSLEEEEEEEVLEGGDPVSQQQQQGQEQESLLSRETEEHSDRIVPQLKIGEDGNIVLDEGSMLMESTKTDPEEAANSLEVVYETSASPYSNMGLPKRKSRMRLWTAEETKLFYKSLSQVGTDFTMMTLLVTTRSREDLKKKFKKEEKLNPLKVNQALKKRIPLTTEQ